MAQTFLTVEKLCGIVNAGHKIKAFERDNKSLPPISRALAYALTKTISKCKAIYSEIEALEKPSEKIVEYEKSRVSLAEKHSKKDANGVAMLNSSGTAYQVENLAIFESDIANLKLDLDYDNEIKWREESLKARDERLKESENVDVHQISLDYFPENLPLELFELLEPLIKED